MKKIFKPLSLIVASALLSMLLLTSCSSSNNTGSDASQEPASPDPAASVDSTESAQPSQPVDDTVYTFNIDYPNSENTAVYPVLAAWADYVNEQSGGRIDAKIYSNAALGKLPDCVTNCVSGLTDGFWSGVTIYAGVFSCTEVFGLPAMGANNHQVVTAAMNAMLTETDYLAPQWDSLYVVALHSGPISPILFAADKNVTSAADMSGLNLRISNAYTTKWFELLGVNGVTCGFNDGYEYIEKGIIDGGLFFYDQLQGLALYEIIDHMLIGDESIYPLTMFCLNKDDYNALPDDLKQIIDDSRQWFVDQLPAVFDEQIDYVLGKCDEYDVQYYEADDAFSAEITAAAEESWQLWIDTMTNNGFDGQGIFDSAMSYIDQFNAVYPD